LRLASGEEFLWRPVVAGLCNYRDVSESRVSLGDLAVMNELLDVKDFNDWAAAQHGRDAEQPPTTDPFARFGPMR